MLGSAALSLLASTPLAAPWPQEPTAEVVHVRLADGAAARLRELTDLRRTLGLPPKTRVRRADWRADELAAMRAVERGLQSYGGGRTGAAAGAGPQQSFRSASRRDPTGGEALLGLAATTPDPVLATFAIASIGERAGLTADPDRLANLLFALLDREEAVAQPAFERLVWLLDAHPDAGGLAPRIEAMADALGAPGNRAVKLGNWQAGSVTGPTRTSVLPIRSPHDAASRTLALASVFGDPERMLAITRSPLPGNFKLICHLLGAPRTNAEVATRMFGWYSRGLEKWPPPAPEGLNDWRRGVIATLVAVLPRLPAGKFDWYRANLAASEYEAATAVAARHRLERLAADRNQPFAIDDLRLENFGALDLLRMWRALGNPAGCELTGAVAAAPRQANDTDRRGYLGMVLRSAPRPPARARARAIATLERLWCGADHATAHAAALCAASLGTSGTDALTEWVRTTIGERRGRVGIAWEVAIELDLPVPEGDGKDAMQHRLRELHAAMLTAVAGSPASGEELRNQLAKPFPERGGELRSLLLAARRLPNWPNDLTIRIAQHTTHANPWTRRAAYLALASRPRATCRFAELTDEAAFDANPLVRSLRTVPGTETNPKPRPQR